jgi:hypothetical protein
LKNKKGETPSKEKPVGRAKKPLQTPLEAVVARSQRGLTIKGKDRSHTCPKRSKTGYHRRKKKKEKEKSP